ncbi:MAG: hypothetical protein DRJ13_05995 [Bacteroidetes bacterium]|nr:MAG: hypothetical protein DRJ13_05995 [Bacteroidota bacterium]
MMKNNALVVMILPLLLYASSCSNKSYIEYRGELTIIHLKGSPFERGVAYGDLLHKEIHETISNWEGEIEDVFQTDLQTTIGDFFNRTTYNKDLRRLHSDLIEEVYGMSESTGIDFSTLLAFQLSEELSTVMEDDGGSNCTTIGIAGNDTLPTILAQNMDPPFFLHGHPLVLHIIPEKNKPESYVFSVPGLLGMAGLNEKGVAVTCNGISMLNHASHGMPVVSIVRRILSQQDLEHAVDFLKGTSFAIPQCYTVGGVNGVRCFECSANQIAEFYPFEESNIALHTNFPIRNRDFTQKYVELLQAYGKTVNDPYYCPRYFLAYDKIKEYHRKLNINSIQSILRLAEPDMEPILNRYTLGTLVMELDSSPSLLLALGQKEGAKFHRLEF